MSFADLRKARQSKESQSFVEPDKDLVASETQDHQEEGSTVHANEVIHLSEGLYKKLPASLDIRSSETAGRGVWMKDTCSPGSILISTQPHTAVLSNQYLDSICSSCCGPPQVGDSLKRCTQCQTLWYCGSACQNRDWAAHKTECTALQQWAASAPSADVAVPSEAVRCLGRMLRKRQKQGLTSVWAREIDAMQSRKSSLPQSATETHTHLAHSLVRYLELTSPADLAEYELNSATELVDFISRFVTNTFTLTSPSLTPIGIAVSPVVALINHSCEPNAVVVFPRAGGRDSQKHEPRMEVVALGQIKKDEEILTAYIDTTLPLEKRQEALKATYNFTCHCRLCAGVTGVDMREAMYCPKSCGGICPVPTEEDSFSRCIKCKSVVSSTDAVLDALRVGQEGLDKATVVQSRDPAKAIQLTTNLIPIITSAGLTPSSHPLLALTRLHQSLLISSLPANMTQEILDAIVITATKGTTGLSNILCEGHPVRGIALAELGKTLAVDEPSPSARPAGTYPPSGPPRLKLAYDTLLRAREELLIGFGKANDGGQVGWEVRESIVSLEKEIGVWSQGVRNVRSDTVAPRAIK